MLRVILVSLSLSAGSVFAQCHVDSLYITTSDSVKLFVKRSGVGYPVLFIHGGPGSNSYLKRRVVIFFQRMCS